MQYTPIVGLTREGNTVWYTGRAGEGFISADPKEAFLGYSQEGAQNRAMSLNRMTDLHGVHFMPYPKLRANIEQMVAAHYVVSPNNIWGREGVGMYTAGPGVMRPSYRMEIWVTGDGVQLYNAYRDEKPLMEFPDVDAFLAWVAENGTPSEGGLPAFSNSWD